ncbi:TatD DNase family protein [Pullulanibacillus pueri]|uniref:Hydrolase TatD n=1 Tax=Pullulanibacillus pueri TaxID=1437324 RepID=A0A8J2ZZI3_9BACL|nr:TatD family hydrolase [Pullulanibacillus pueri]MBM7683996.1 TatD DNase family protein [Pullulanibacillus pueri]GGH88343.1 hydrolase TatD [Pullulanibacillus pueri]
MLFDTHTHINAEEFDQDREEVIKRARDTGVSHMVVVGFDRSTITRAMNLVKEHDDMFAAVGWHPVDAIDMTDEDLDWIESLAHDPKVVALGEMGLDYHWDKSPATVQKQVFRRQIQLAKKLDMPIIIHNREATEDIVAILEEEDAQQVGGIMHCYSSDWETAKRCLDMNFYLSFGGPVTFKNGHLAKEVATQVPLDRLLIETDCPYLSPHPFRGKRNEPARVKLVAEQIAALKGLTYEALASITSDNAKRLFKIKH